LIYKYYSKRRDDSNSRITSNSRIIGKKNRNLSNSRNSNNSRDARKTAEMPITAGTGEMLKTPIAEGTLAAVGTGATADTLTRRGIILYYTLCISHSRDSWDVNSRKSIGNSKVNSSTLDSWIRKCQQRKGRKNC
jgi:hypothetical protein